jgi:hypothetical protein
MKNKILNIEINFFFMMIICYGCTGNTPGGDGQHGVENIPTKSYAPLPDDINSLIILLHDNDYELRIMATIKIGFMGSLGKNAVPALSTNLFTENSDLRIETILTLGKIGSESKPANTLLIISLLNDKNVQARRVAAEALGQIGVKESVPALYYALNDTDEIVAWKSAISIDRIMELNIYSKTGLNVNEKGDIVIIEKIREWWNIIGSQMNWTE